MKPFGRLFGFGCVLFYSHASAAEAPCPLASARDVAFCAAERHPDVLRAAAELRAAESLETLARERPNPQVDGQGITFDNEEQPGFQIEANLFHTFELGRKRQRRIDEARQERQVAEARLLETREQVLIQSTLNLTRLRQIKREIQAREEAMHSFDKVIRAFKSRASRSAEQEVSVKVYELARAEYLLSVSTLKQERMTIDTYFQTATGRSHETLAAVFLPEPVVWPELVASTAVASSGALRRAQGEARLSGARHDAARAAAWPDFKAGPRIVSQSGHGQAAQGYGMALSLPLPLYQRQEGKRRATEQLKESAELALEQTRRAQDAERRQWVTVYESARAANAQTPAAADVEKQHQVLESLFERGLVTAPLVIEAHRQVNDYLKVRHENDRQALEALTRIQAIDGALWTK